MAKFFERKERRNPLIAIVGPTSSGKSELAVRLAKKFEGEVVSADSRQAYKGLDIGSGKITKKEMRGVPHYLLNVASPKRKFTVAQYQKLALKAIRGIQRRGKLPILVGGTPFYVYAVVDGYVFPEVKPNPTLRAELEKLSGEQLLAKLKKLDPERAATVEQKNKRRLIRALEIVLSTGKPVPYPAKQKTDFDAVIIGLKRSPEELRERIERRLQKRLKQGMIKEVERLHAEGVSWRRLKELGLEYQNVAQYLQGKMSKQEMIDRIQKESEDFARRQMTWFKKDARVHWIEGRSEAERLVRKFLG